MNNLPLLFQIRSDINSILSTIFNGPSLLKRSCKSYLKKFQEMLLGGGATAYQSPYISSAVATSEACSGPPSPTTSPVSLAPLTLMPSLPPPPMPLESLHHQRPHQIHYMTTTTSPPPPPPPTPLSHHHHHHHVVLDQGYSLGMLH